MLTNLVELLYFGADPSSNPDLADKDILYLWTGGTLMEMLYTKK